MSVSGRTAAHAALLLLLSVGLFNAASLSWQTWTGSGPPCPAVGPVPACYVVALGYLAMLVAALGPQRSRRLFAIGWLPIFALALVGSSLELLYGNVCPRLTNGVPACYLSLLLAVAAAVLFRYTARQQR